MWRGDWRLDANGSLADGEDMATAVMLSLFTDRTALPDDIPPDGGVIRGWWADTFFTYALGSRLWLLWREKHTEKVRRRAEEYCREALAWLIAEDVARKVDVTAAWIRKGWLEVQIDIIAPSGLRQTWRYPMPWAQLVGR